MKLRDILEHDIVSQEKQKPRVFWMLPKMKRVYPPFTKGAFKKLINPTGGKQIKDPAGGKVVKQSNSMEKQEISS